VLVEATALVQARLGAAAVRELHTDLLAPVQVVWVDASVHQVAVAALIASAGPGVSLVDRVSFEVMRRRGIDAAFTFDRHYVEEGFATVP
jgi:predicted nucleic acid-binding protein